ncbi:MAG: carboxypeptidase-like regulatory domain-containing protein [Chitinophagaceae bacterium]|nr:MAG: carboxypeptidase-like regulatory domain-containing protein [Chitinophagaceae bacterium]
MKKIVFLLTAIICGISGFAQSSFVVTGKVILASTKQPLQGASVFAQNTTFGTATDADGNFKLYLPDGGYSIAVTFTGYNTESRRISNNDPNDRNLLFELSEKEKQMEEVAIVSSSEVKDGWNKYGQFFLNKFIGQTENSAAVSLKNPEALKFYFSKKKNRLKVMSAEPLQIENNALGYNIKYVLDSFTYEYSTELSVYTGSPLFEEKITADSIQQIKWSLARAKAYKGSILHFMRSLYDKKLKEEGFEVQFLVNVNDKETTLPLKDFYTALNYTKDDSLALVEVKPNQQRVGVIYLKEKPSPVYQAMNPDEPSDFQFSVLGFLPGESLDIEQNGYYFDQDDLTINAYWTWDKVADLLPYDYGRAAVAQEANKAVAEQVPQQAGVGEPQQQQ